MIDIYTHIMPPRFFDELTKTSPKLGNIGGRMRNVKPIHDLDVRFRLMDGAGADYAQVISLPNPPLEDVCGPEDARRLAAIGNDGMTEICAKYPDRFPAFVASISMLDMDGALAEIERAITQLGARGVQIFTNVAGKPLDLPEYEPVFAAMARHDLPIWLHPARTSDMTDYAGEEKSRFEMWWCFGWPYETSVAMARIVFSGLLDRYPDLNIITHHCGGMIPYFDGRVGPGLDVLGGRTLDEDYSNVLPSLKRPHLEYFRRFYGDTAMFGASTGLHSGLKFFGADHVVFSTDSPFAPIKETIAALGDLGLSPSDMEKITAGNAKRLLKL
ncbi:MAG: amidohydrolase family protein [Beijerinckiaceae bacterium]|nr:amidohydrolase family protein [Beijerinckiaceae bacterium]